MKWAVLIFAALSLTGCDIPKKAPDGYHFEQGDFERNEIEVTMIQYDNRADFERSAKRLGAYTEGLEAFGEVGISDPWCRIHIMRVSQHYEPEWLGHEVTHCIYGQWHRNQAHGV